jgi:hypothetical protein
MIAKFYYNTYVLSVSNGDLNSLLKARGFTVPHRFA